MGKIQKKNGNWGQSIWFSNSSSQFRDITTFCSSQGSQINQSPGMHMTGCCSPPCTKALHVSPVTINITEINSPIGTGQWYWPGHKTDWVSLEYFWDQMEAIQSKDQLFICQRGKILWVPLSKHMNWPNRWLTSSTWPIGEQNAQLLLWYTNLQWAYSSYDHYTVCGMALQEVCLAATCISPSPGYTRLT